MGFTIFNLFRARSVPEDAGFLNANLDQAERCRSAGQLAKARALCELNLSRQPQHVESLLLLGELARLLGDTESARDAYTRIVALKPIDAVAYYKRGNLLKDQGDLSAALVDYDRAIGLDASHAHAFCNRGVVLEQLGRWEAALDSLSRAIALNPDDALAHYNRAAVLRELKKPESALESYDRAIAANPAYVEAYCNRGALLIELKRWDAALQSLERSIALAPSFAPAYFNRALLYHKRRRREEALADYNRSIALSPDYAAAYAGRGGLSAEIAYNELALADFAKAIALLPNQVEARIGQADILLQQKQFEAAVASYDQALALDPEHRFLLGMRLHAKMHLCDWSDFELDLSRLIAGIEAGKPMVPPFPATALLDAAALQRAVTELYVREEYPEDSTLGEIAPRMPGEKIKIGYFSADFRAHPVALLTAEVFELHDRARFEVIAFAFGPESNDAMRERLQKGFDRFIDVRHRSDPDVAALAREIGIDIAVDLGGFTAYCRPGIFALRAAPIQISYIGYLGTIGASYMDYLIADATIIPPERRKDYSEKIIYLPSYQANDSHRRMSERIFTREELGLPHSGFVFCCFNANYKITPSTYAVWMRILRRVPQSSLFLYVNDETSRDRLCEQAEGCGVESRRIVFASRIPIEDYLARFRTMDLFLDTLPYNAGTTASDALWSGLPVLTCLGEGFAARVAASLLMALEMPELITNTATEYEDLAVELATNQQRLMTLTDKLARNRVTTELFDTRRFVANLEIALVEIYSRNQARAPLDHVYVKAVKPKA